MHLCWELVSGRIENVVFEAGAMVFPGLKPWLCVIVFDRSVALGIWQGKMDFTSVRTERRKAEANGSDRGVTGGSRPSTHSGRYQRP